MNSIRNGYIVKYFKRFSFIPTLFIASVLSTLFILCERYGIIDSFEKGNFSTYVISVSSYFVALYIIFALSNAKQKKLSISDSINFAILLTCLVYVLYTVLVSKKITLFRILVPSVIFVIMVLITTIRTAYFIPYEEKGKVYYTKHSINAYYHTLFKNYSFFGVLMFSLGLTCLSFLIIVANYTINFSSANIIVPLIVCGLMVSLLIYNSISKKIGVLDASVLSLTITLIPALLQVLLLVNNAELRDTYLIYWSVFLGITLILTTLRYIFFDISKIGKNTAEEFSGPRVIAYFKKISYKYGLGIIFTTALVAVMIFICMLIFADVKAFYKISVDNRISIHFNIIPAGIVNLLFIGTIIIGAVLSIANLRATKITFGDFLMLLNIIFSLVACFIIFLLNNLEIRFYLLIGVFIYSFIILIFRILRVCPKSFDKI